MWLSLSRTLRIFAILGLSQSLAAHAADPLVALKNVIPEVEPLVSGIGVAVRPQKTEIGYEILQLVKNGPAALSCEIQPGDTIIGVGNDDSFPDDIDIRELDFQKVIGLIRGPEDSEVRVRIIPKSSAFVKEKVVSLKRRLLVDEKLLGNPFEVELQSLDDGKPIVKELLEGRAVVLFLWSEECVDCLPLVRNRIDSLAARDEFSAELKLIAVNCDATREIATTSLQKFSLEGVRHAWIEKSKIESVVSNMLPLTIVISPIGQVEAICHPEAINLERFLKRYKAIVDAGK